MNRKDIAIIGGGPAGLSLAKFLSNRDFAQVTVYEAKDTVGGKSESFYHGDAVVELGTCYATLYDKTTKSWMKELNIKLIRNGTSNYDGADFMDFVRKGDGEHFYLQALKFVAGGNNLRRRLATKSPTQETLAEAAMPILDWVRERGLFKMERFLYRALTGMGYGFVHETPTVQAHRWCGFPLLLSGAINQLHAPDIGWSEFWRRLAEPFDLDLGKPVVRIERIAEKTIVSTEKGSKQFDHVINTIPMDVFVDILENPSEQEILVAESVHWQSYATTLLAVENWFDDIHTRGWSEGTSPGAAYGKLIAARKEAYEPDIGGQLYVTGQLSKDLKKNELVEILRDAIVKDGANITNIIEQRVWRYFPMYDKGAIEAGLLQTMREMQGQNNTWYSGSTFAFEAVGPIVNFNEGLADQIQTKLTSNSSSRRRAKKGRK